MMQRAKKLAIHIGTDAPNQVTAMLARQDLTGMTTTMRQLPHGAIGCLGIDELPEQGNICFFTGLPIHEVDGPDPVDADGAIRVFTSCDGAFVGVFWDALRQRLTLVTDCLGMQPLYLRHTDGELTIVSETKAISGEPDLAAWGAFIAIGHPIGNRSLVDGLTRVPPASILTYGCATDRLDIRRYWQWPEPSDDWRDFDFLGSLERDIQAYAALGDPGTLLLSGGFDSRLLLFLLQRAHVPVEALIVAHDDELDNADGRLAEMIVQRAGIRYRVAKPDRDFFSSSGYLAYVKAIDAAFPSMDLFIAKVDSQIDSRVVWDGLMPGVMFKPPCHDETTMDGYLRHHVPALDGAVWEPAKAVFRRDVVDAMRDGFQSDLRAETGRLRPDIYGVARFVIENRRRNRAAMNPLKVYANHSRAFTPGLNKAFVGHAAMIPFHDHSRIKFYRALLARLDRRALSAPILGGGQLTRAARCSTTYWHERVRVAVHNCRARHPRAFPGFRIPPSPRSILLGDHLFRDGDAWLNPRLPATLDAGAVDNVAVRRLLFHWQAWQWVHGRKPRAIVDPG